MNELNFRRYRFATRCILCPTCGQRVSVVDGADLRRVRKEAGVSLRGMAMVMGVSAPYLCDVELNRRACTKKVEAGYSNLALANIPNCTAEEATFVERRDIR